MQAYILINCNTGSETKVISELKELPEIVEINGIWGKYDIFLKIKTVDPNGVEEIIKRLRNHPGARCWPARRQRGGSRHRPPPVPC